MRRAKPLVKLPKSFGADPSMLKLGTVRWNGRCKRHPRYDPVDGEGAIRGGCQRCMQLLEIYRQHKQLVEMMRTFGPVPQRKVKEPPARDNRQGSLFDGV